jgi:Domain of unknown function (DUF4180)
VPAFFEAEAMEAVAPLAAVVRCIEHGARGLLFDRGALPSEFFDLRSGVAGELVQKLVNYGLRLAAVVPDLEQRPLRFREFALEANRGRQLRFCATREEAIAWLEGDPGPRP